MHKQVFAEQVKWELDIDGLRKGYYTDAYFQNTVCVLSALAQEGYHFQGKPDLESLTEQAILTGDIAVEMQYFCRRQPKSLVAGIPEVLEMLRTCTGYFDDDGEFINTFSELEVEAVEEGSFVHYAGDPEQVEPVLRIRGRYRDFALLETPILGTLSEATRIATNVYNSLVAAKGKDILFFPARFAHYRMQSQHGYAYALAVSTYNQLHGGNAKILVSSQAQASLWGGQGSGTVPHALIACFLGDGSETMLQFARLIAPEVPRIALVDFHNDCVGETLSVMTSLFPHWLKHYLSGDLEKARRYKLSGVRPDTSGQLRDISVPPLGDKELDLGVTPRLVWALRQAIDQAYQTWDLPHEQTELARAWCREVKIIATGGFDAERIRKFEQLGVPIDAYGVGSSLLDNSRKSGTNNDYTADIVGVKVDDVWYPLAKVGRKAGVNKNLRRRL